MQGARLVSAEATTFNALVRVDEVVAQRIADEDHLRQQTVGRIVLARNFPVPAKARVWAIAGRESVGGLCRHDMRNSDVATTHNISIF